MSQRKENTALDLSRPEEMAGAQILQVSNGSTAQNIEQNTTIIKRLFRVDLGSLGVGQSEKIAYLVWIALSVLIFLSSCFDRPNPPVQLTAGASAFIAIASTWMAKAKLRKRVRRARIFGLCLAAAVTVASLWLFIYRERIRHTWLNTDSDEPRVVVAEDVAWQILSFAGPNGNEHNNVVGEVESLLANEPHQIKIWPATATVAWSASEGDSLFLNGVSEQDAFVFQVNMVITLARVERLLELTKKPLDLSKATGEKGSRVGTGKKFFRNQFLFSKFQLSMPLRNNLSGETRTALVRLMIRYGLAVCSYLDGDIEKATKHFTAILELGKLLSVEGHSELALLYKATAYFFGVEGKDHEKVQTALALARTFDPEDREVRVMQAYVALISGNVTQCGAILAELDPSGEDPSQIHALRGYYEEVLGRLEEAGADFDRAAASENDEQYRGYFLLQGALTFARREGDDESRSKEMIERLTDASHLDPQNCVYPIILGFAWALQKNVGLSDDSFRQARELGCDDHKLYGYWQSRSNHVLGRAIPASAEVAPAEKLDDAGTALMIARDLMAVEGRHAEADKYLDRVLELDPKRAKAYRYKCILAARQWEKMPGDHRELRAQINKEARRYCMESISLGEDLVVVHALLATLYEHAGDSVNARKHSRIVCQRVPKSPTCAIYAGEEFVRKGEYAKAVETFDAATAQSPKDGSISLEIGLIWYKAGRLEESVAAYRQGLELSPESCAGHNNLAYVLLDQKRYDDALSEWTVALGLDPADADATAGKALALAAKGRHSEALATYKEAVAKDSTYLDCARLRTEHLWSEHACRLAKPLIEGARAEH